MRTSAWTRSATRCSPDRPSKRRCDQAVSSGAFPCAATYGGTAFRVAGKYCRRSRAYCEDRQGKEIVTAYGAVKLALAKWCVPSPSLGSFHRLPILRHRFVLRHRCASRPLFVHIALRTFFRNLVPRAGLLSGRLICGHDALLVMCNAGFAPAAGRSAISCPVRRYPLAAAACSGGQSRLPCCLDSFRRSGWPHRCSARQPHRVCISRARCLSILRTFARPVTTARSVAFGSRHKRRQTSRATERKQRMNL